MKRTVLIIIALAGILNAYAQRGRTAVLKEISGMEVIKTIYPEASKVEQQNEVWFEILDADGNLIGYTLSSKPFSDDIIGYRGATPVIVIMDKNKVIRKVSILSHKETISYINRLTNWGFFDNWNGLTVSDAKEKQVKVDAYTGATMTAVSLIKNMDIILEKAAGN
ncbi:FMN-binding protein [Parabacteroides sp. OttesenSCG-928-G07]|nr:FMN-binding protein [Parabacteroides sp. OttesenSCG-928-G21]MDL2277802.1 FMN-binding protein [Parabacteroides sp. OttesenSCG-928-G07]